jgi:hypothetical protein
MPRHAPQLLISPKMKNRKLITAKWDEMHVLLEKMGATVEQRTLMAQCFFGGAYAAGNILSNAFMESETPDDFAAVLTEVMKEMQEVTKQGVPVSKPKRLILMPGQ